MAPSSWALPHIAPWRSLWSSCINAGPESKAEIHCMPGHYLAAVIKTPQGKKGFFFGSQLEGTHHGGEDMAAGS